MKSTLNNLEQFEELNACKLKYEKIFDFKRINTFINGTKWIIYESGFESATSLQC